MVFPLYDDNPFRLPVKPIVTWLLILANFVVFVAEFGGGDEAAAQALVDAFGVTPAALIGGSLAGARAGSHAVHHMFLPQCNFLATWSSSGCLAAISRRRSAALVSSCST
jgi:membrane associated rhomboid family serine protease